MHSTSFSKLGVACAVLLTCAAIGIIKRDNHSNATSNPVSQVQHTSLPSHDRALDNSQATSSKICNLPAEFIHKTFNDVTLSSNNIADRILGNEHKINLSSVKEAFKLTFENAQEPVRLSILRGIISKSIVDIGLNAALQLIKDNAKILGPLEYKQLYAWVFTDLRISDVLLLEHLQKAEVKENFLASQQIAERLFNGSSQDTLKVVSPALFHYATFVNYIDPGTRFEGKREVFNLAVAELIAYLNYFKKEPEEYQNRLSWNLPFAVNFAQHNKENAAALLSEINNGSFEISNLRDEFIRVLETAICK